MAEVKGIYAGLVMVESKCIEVANNQMQTDPANKPSNDQWQALIALHRTLLHEHHDFFLASQHPSASPALQRLAAKYAMPARMWRHGIHGFLDLGRHRLPKYLDHMLTLIYTGWPIRLVSDLPACGETLWAVFLESRSLLVWRGLPCQGRDVINRRVMRKRSFTSQLYFGFGFFFFLFGRSQATSDTITGHGTLGLKRQLVPLFGY